MGSHELPPPDLGVSADCVRTTGKPEVIGSSVGVSGKLACAHEFGSFKSGDVKGTIRSDMRLRLVSNDVRRHRLISISYISLLPCHGSVLDRTDYLTGPTDCRTVSVIRLARCPPIIVCRACVGGPECRGLNRRGTPVFHSPQNSPQNSLPQVPFNDLRCRPCVPSR
jgi:hypothetical protein